MEPCVGWKSRSLQRKGQFRDGRACLDMPNNTAVSCAKTAEPIEMPFGLWTWVSRRRHVSHGNTLVRPGE